MENLKDEASRDFAAILSSHNCPSTHPLDKGVYQLAVHVWVCGDQSVCAFSSHFRLQKVDDTDNLIYAHLPVIVDVPNFALFVVERLLSIRPKLPQPTFCMCRFKVTHFLVDGILKHLDCNLLSSMKTCP
ncbi:hypothetical protein ACTXT7_011149 [Hymenolepis weldensis]